MRESGREGGREGRRLRQRGLVALNALGNDIRGTFRTPMSGVIMSTKNEECCDSFAAFSQPSNASSF